jgi:adenylate kinase family enzyme
VKRVNVKGISGSGKSTFALELARRLGLPYVELDAVHHGPNWSEPTDEVFRARVQAAMDAAPDGWVIDGNYEGKLGELVLSQADTIVWLDLPLHTSLGRMWRRTTSRIRDGTELWDTGNRETWANFIFRPNSLLLYTLRTYHARRRQWAKQLAGRNVVRLRSEAEVSRWLAAQPPPPAPG